MLPVMTRRSQIYAELQALYDQVPVIPDCDGSCWISCGPTDMADAERARIRRAGYRITPGSESRLRADVYWCEALTADRRCAVYDMRPLICRLWGAVEGMRCPRECVPEGGWLPDETAWRLLIDARRVGDNSMPGNMPVDRALSQPEIRRELEKMWGDATHRAISLRARYLLPAAARPPEDRTFSCPRCSFMLTVPPVVTGPSVCGNCGTLLLTIPK